MNFMNWNRWGLGAGTSDERPEVGTILPSSGPSKRKGTGPCHTLGGRGTENEVGIMAKRVETEEEGRALIGTGGRWGQGYAISSPLSPENVPDWIGSWTSSPSWNKKRQGFPCLSLALDRGPDLGPSGNFIPSYRARLSVFSFLIAAESLSNFSALLSRTVRFASSWPA